MERFYAGYNVATSKGTTLRSQQGPAGMERGQSPVPEVRTRQSHIRQGAVIEHRQFVARTDALAPFNEYCARSQQYIFAARFCRLCSVLPLLFWTILFPKMESKRRSVLAPNVKRGAIGTVTIFQKRTSSPLCKPTLIDPEGHLRSLPPGYSVPPYIMI